MVEKIGGPDRLRAVAKHRTLEATLRLVEHCYHTANKLDLEAWDEGALEVLKEILCYCCHCHPTYLKTLRKDSWTGLTEVHRGYMKGYTPPTEAYAMLCTQVKDIAMTERPPLPVWVSGQRTSGRRANKSPGLVNHGCV